MNGRGNTGNLYRTSIVYLNVIQYYMIEDIFDGDIPPSWKIMLYSDWVKRRVFYEGGEEIGIVASYMHEDILIINSGTIRNRQFPFRMLRYILDMVKSHDNVVVQSTRSDIAESVSKHYGGKYSEVLGFYYKGITWEQE